MAAPQKARKDIWHINGRGPLASSNLPVLAVSTDRMAPGLGQEKRDSTEIALHPSRPELTENTTGMKKEPESQSPSIFDK